MTGQPDGSTRQTEGALWRSEPEAFTLDLPALFHSQVAGGEAPAAGSTEERLFTRGLPLAASWVQRGYLVLHAAAVALPSGAVAVAGPSGAGKSVLAAALAQRGAPLLADEVLPIELHPGGALPLAHPSDTDLLLWRRSAERLGYDPATLAAARAGLERYWLTSLPAASAPQPLVRVYLLGVHNAPEVKVERLRGHERVLALMRPSFNRYLAETTARRQQLLLRLAALPAGVRVLRVWRPELGWSVPALLAALEEDLAQ